MARDLSAYAPSTKYPEMLYLFGVGDHGGGPTRAMLQTAERWREDAVYPRLSLGTVQPYFDALAKQAPTMDLPAWKKELYLEFHRGVYTTQAETKKGNRRSEELLLTTEKLSSFAALTGQTYPKDDLRLAWKKVLFNQFHDIASGSGIPAVYKDAARDYAEVDRIGQAHLHAAVEEILSRVNTAGTGEPVAVFSPLSWKRTDLVEAEVQLPEGATNVEVFDSRGSPVLAEPISKLDAAHVTVRFLAGDVPPLGYKIFRVAARSKKKEQTSPLSAGPDFIENEFYRVRVDPKTGCITSLWDKVANWESIDKAACGNQLQVFADNPSEYDAWNIDADFEKQQWNLDTADEVRLVENGPLRSVLRVRKHFRHSTFEQNITLVAGVARVDVAMHVDWHEKHILLKAAFPVSVRSDTATYEIPFGSIARPTTRRTPEERAKFEVPALRWADLSDAAHGLSLLNDSKYGYDCKDHVLRLSLLRSPAWPDPHADEGVQDFTYSVFLHGPRGKDAGTMRSGYELNSRLIAVATGSHSGELPPEHSFVSIEPENLIITAFKQSEDGKDLILRFYEFEGRKTTAQITLPPSVAKAFDANLMEQEGAKVAFDGKTAMVDVGPNEIKTLKLRLQKPAGKN
jgi:alpha-mannosidase